MLIWLVRVEFSTCSCISLIMGFKAPSPRANLDINQMHLTYAHSVLRPYNIGIWTKCWIGTIGFGLLSKANILTDAVASTAFVASANRQPLHLLL